MLRLCVKSLGGLEDRLLGWGFAVVGVVLPSSLSSLSVVAVSKARLRAWVDARGVDLAPPVDLDGFVDDA